MNNLLKCWLSDLARKLVLVIAFAPWTAQASEDSLCHGLWLLNRLPGDAMQFLGAPSSSEARWAFRRDLASAEQRFADDMQLSVSSRFANSTSAVIGLHRRILELTESGHIEAARALVQSPEWRSGENWLGNEMRLRHCSDAPAHKRPASARAREARLNPISSTSKVADRSWRKPSPAAVFATLVGLAVIAAIAAGGILVHRLYLHRSAPRFVCFIAGVLQNDFNCDRIEVVDISRYGCKLRLHHSIDMKQPVDLYFGAWSTRAKAVWSNEHFAGFKFDLSLAPARLKAILDDAHRKRDGETAAVPSLPCFTTSCQSTCPKYKVRKEKEAAAAGTQAGPVVPIL